MVTISNGLTFLGPILRENVMFIITSQQIISNKMLLAKKKVISITGLNITKTNFIRFVVKMLTR